MKFYISLFLLVFLGNKTFAEVFKIQELQNDTCAITFFHDFHSVEGKEKEKFKQRSNMLNLAVAKNAFVVVEDAEIPQNGHSALCDNPVEYDPSQFSLSAEEFKKYVLHAPLHGFSSCCKYKKIPHQNIEFRQIKLASTHYHDDAIKAAAVFERTERIANEISHYNDNEILNIYYQDVLERYTATKNKYCAIFDCIKTSDLSLRLLIAQMYKDERCKESLIKNCNKSGELSFETDRLIEQLLHFFDRELIDARLVHTIYSQASSNKDIFVLAGSAHINRILPILTSLKYRSTFIFGNDYNGEVPSMVDIADYVLSYKQHRMQRQKKQKRILIMEDGIPLEELSEIFNKNLKKMNKEIKRIHNAGKGTKQKKKLHHSFKNS